MSSGAISWSLGIIATSHASRDVDTEALAYAPLCDPNQEILMQ